MLDAAFLSHVVFWLIGAIVVVGTVSSIGAMYWMGRATNRKD
ncbi:hypothetical protein [Microbacterium suwonense]|uniref:Uncharacterized protein n=1 Tax=Microbacterium suwonense TaxID=683047 RepID=A0ABM8FQL7_9MICO|nr:hypothetical protein [Microbacterium suwonense]BDZ37706.1 hypothetical protein GCM10025863_03200 [Microbacterium suwonense]